MTVSAKDRLLFENLFVLEAANNHWGSLERGLKLVQDFGIVVRYNNVKAAIKFQFRDVDSFIHPDFKGSKELRYINKTEATAMQKEQYGELVRKVREVGCIPMATPFDEKSVELCVAFDLPILKIASSDINDWLLLEAIARTKKPVIVSSGGASEKSLDEVVQFFENRNIPIAINHCVSIYPSEEDQLELDQIDYLKSRYSDHIIGFSSHEYKSWDKSMYLSYAKGARTWERHIDIDYQGVPVSPYCSKPENIDQWFKAFHDANRICGDSSTKRRNLSIVEIEYLDALVRGVYARKDLSRGYVFQKDSFEKNFYMAVPLQKGQLSAREVLNGEVLVRDIQADGPLMIHDINGPFAETPSLRSQIENRGLGTQSKSE